MVLALEFGAEFGVKKVVMESDSEIIVNALKTDGSVVGSIASILKDATLFSSSSLNYSTLMLGGNVINLPIVWPSIP